MENKNWDIVSIGKLHREISQGKYSERELATKIYEQNNELKQMKLSLERLQEENKELSDTIDSLLDVLKVSKIFDPKIFQENQKAIESETRTSENYHSIEEFNQDKE